MLPVGRQEYLVLVLLKILMFNFQQNTTEACTDTVITACNDTTTCIQRYGEVYKSLGSSINYFNIAQALYPAKWLPSLRVNVKLHGANGTENCRPVKYTWSMSCIFATFPKYVLEILSLGAILVTPRTQDLNITINPFCCNVSKEDRITMIETALAAVSKKVCSLRFLRCKLQSSSHWVGTPCVVPILWQNLSLHRWFFASDMPPRKNQH